MWKTHLEILPHTEKLWKKIGKNHGLALELWQTGIYDARLLAFLIDESEKVTKTQMNKWAKDFNSWDITDGTCLHFKEAVKLAGEIKKLNSKSARWIANDALRELKILN